MAPTKRRRTRAESERARRKQCHAREHGEQHAEGDMEDPRPRSRIDEIVRRVRRYGQW